MAEEEERRSKAVVGELHQEAEGARYQAVAVARRQLAEAAGNPRAKKKKTVSDTQ
jgi:hypothetical protein